MALQLEALGELVGVLGLGGVTAEVRTAALPPLKVSAAEAAEAAGRPSALGPLLRPVLEVRGAQGDTLVRVAPYGEPPAWSGWAVVIGVPLALVAVGFALGRL